MAVNIQTERLEWADIKAMARDIFHIWVGSPELAWAEHAWEALDQQGLTSYTTEVERSACLVRLLTLGALYHEFCTRAFEEGSPGEWRDDITSDLIGEYPLLDAFSLGQLAERTGVHADNLPYVYENVLSEALADLAEAEQEAVVAALLAAWGEATLFASLWVSNSEHDGYPLTDEAVDDVVNSDVTAGKGMAYEWVMAGMPLG